MTIATLGINIQCAPALKAATDIGKIVPAAQKAERAVDGMAGSTVVELGRVSQAADRASGSFSRLGGGSIQNVSRQFTDMAVQIGSGQSASVALAQQLPQLLDGLGPLGAALGLIAAVGVPVGAALLGAGSGAKTAAEGAKELADQSERLSAANTALLQTESDLIKAYGTHAGAMREILQMQADVEKLDFTSKLRQQIDTLANTFGELGATSERFDSLFGGSDWTTFDLIARDTAEALHITADEAKGVVDAMYQLRDAKGMDAQASAALNLANQFATAAGGAENLTGAAKSVYTSLVDVARAGESAAVGIAAASAAADNGARAADNAAAAYAQFAQSMRLAQQEKAKADANALGATEDSRTDRGTFLSYQDRQGLKATDPRNPNYRNRSTKTSSRSGGSRTRTNDYDREVAQITKRTAALTAETAAQASLNPLIDDYGFATTKAKSVQELMTAAQQAHIPVTDQLKASIDGLAEGYAGAEAASNRLDAAQDELRQTAQDWASTSKDATKGLIEGFIEGTSKADLLSDAIGRIGDRLIDMSLDSFFGTGSKPGLINFGSLGGLFSGLASFDGGGSTGSGARTGGLDGKGGFLAMMHPRETVTDHTKSGSTVSGSIRVEVGVRQDGNLEAYVTKKASQITAVGVGQVRREVPGIVENHTKRWR
jgi:hypothetical protein